MDRSRARRHLEDAQKRDLDWLGLHWDEETPPQRDRRYDAWLELLPERYFCACTRRTIAEGGGRHPLACRTQGAQRGAVRFALPDTTIQIVDRVHGARAVRPLDFGDPVLRRRDGVFTYNLAVVADDIADGVTEVVRGADLLDYTAVHVVLWEAFGATPPTWMHAPLILGPDGRKLSKSHGDMGIRHLREAGVPAERVVARILEWLGQEGERLEEVDFDPSTIPTAPIRVTDPSAGLL